ncbi:alpha/beta fold hydrolase [Microbacterium sp. 179-I 1D1 NHS]|uniref:alpha/beta fold hydrolase n=1 Tax=Microbacterium sp. 179-I 1D1 NHS TaxID=3374298 RepID=UPI003879C620
MTPQVVFVHGIRTSATMWRAQVEHLTAAGIGANAVDLPGHGTRMSETFTLDGAFETIDRAVTDAAAHGPALLVAHSMGGLVSIEYMGREDRPPVDAFIAAGCTSIPRGAGLSIYRTLARGFDRLPGRGQRLTDMVLDRTLPPETRADFGAGGYAYDTQDIALRSLSVLDLVAALKRISVPMWFVNGQWDQLRLNERLFTALKPEAELIVVPRTSHLVTAMRPRVFNAVIDLALATMAQERSTSG